MNLVIRAHSNKDELVLQPLVGSFDERGGTIGRSETNTLTLPDPNRHISRLQAEIAFSAGAFSIRNVGSSNALLVGGRPVAAGEGVTLGHGDELLIGGYVLHVSVAGAGDTTRSGNAPAIDPRSVIKASLKESRTNPRVRGAASAAAPELRSVDAAQGAFADPFGAARGTSGTNPFADLFGTAPASAPPDPMTRSIPGAAGAAPPPMRLPEDFDPFAELPRHRRADPGTAADSAAALDIGAMLGAGSSAASLDRAFGLGGSNGTVDAVAAFLAAPAPDAKAGRPAGGDPLAMFDAGEATDAPVTSPSAFDHVPELQGAYAPPAVGAALDLELPGPGTSPAAPAAPAPPAAAASTEALWRALCEGAGIAPGQPPMLDAEFMRRLGQVLHHAVDGSLQLIAARAAVKQELRADVTLIQSRNNNPLKFSPDAGAAIEQLLRPPLRGFMSGPAAMQDAMADLLGHAMGTMAGMRAALQGVLQRFEPAQLEHKLGAHKVMDALLPMNRRAKLWERYLLHFERIRNDAQEDFHELFGKAFVQAYEEQLGKLKNERQR